MAVFYGAETDDSASGLAAGDFNGDGNLDLVLSAGRADGPENQRPDAGEAYIFLGPFVAGSERDAAAGADIVILGASADDQLGRTAAAGDVNGDGIDDILLGAPFADGRDETRPDSGAVYVIFGSPDLGAAVREVDVAQGQQDATIYGADEQDLTGFALAVADVSGDGIDDIIVGAFKGDGPDNGRPEAGEVSVIKGGESLSHELDLAEQRDAIIYGAAEGDWLGVSVTGADLNGDGDPDLVAAATFADGPADARPAAGETYIFLAELPQVMDLAHERPDVTVIGADAGDQLGHALAVGDVDGDGFDDLLMSALSSEGLGNETDLAGEAHLLRGRQALPSELDAGDSEAGLVVFGSGQTDRLGRSAAAGDINGDGRADLLLSAPGADGDRNGRNIGSLYVFYGRSPIRLPQTATDADVTLLGRSTGDTLGHEAFGDPPLLIRDINGDGLADIVAAAPWGDGPAEGRPNAGEAYIFFAPLSSPAAD